MSRRLIACPSCGHGHTTVKDARAHRLGARRRRECSGCGHRFTTVEYVTEDPVYFNPGRLSQRNRMVCALQRTITSSEAVAGVARDALKEIDENTKELSI